MCSSDLDDNFSIFASEAFVTLWERLTAAIAAMAVLSGGQQQRVALARALVHEPRLVVCDEPTSALDHETGNAVMELLTTVAVRPGRAVMVVTHDSRIFQFADRIAHMDDGRIVLTTDATSGAGFRSAQPNYAGVN